MDSETEYHLEDFLDGQVWAIDSAPLGLETVKLTKVIPYFSFIEGTKAAPRLHFDEATRRLVERRGLAAASFNRARERRAEFRGTDK